MVRKTFGFDVDLPGADPAPVARIPWPGQPSPVCAAGRADFVGAPSTAVAKDVTPGTETINGPIPGETSEAMVPTFQVLRAYREQHSASRLFGPERLSAGSQPRHPNTVNTDSDVVIQMPPSPALSGCPSVVPHFPEEHTPLNGTQKQL